MKQQTTLVSKKTADQLKEHSDRLDRIDTAVVSFVSIAEEVKRHNHALFGNGDIGIDEQMRNTNKDIQELSVQVHQFIEQQKKDKEQHRAERNQYKLIMYGSIVSFVGNLVMQWINR